jgi:type IV pilus assembly protein PilA
MTANEASAVGSLRTVNAAVVTYLTIYGGYPAALSNLGHGNPATSNSADLIDSVLAAGVKSGYSFSYSASPADAGGHVNTYSVTATPTSLGTSGQRSFFTDQSGVIRQNPIGVADADSPPIG